ncbi:hypothetical protein AB6A40_004160 [Gnathostoma spinigerum]|uniref:Uncharacterized protein n=1 Tax=Gnathostoma spinigerum TaxID=75299 RepID=A0ABD6ECR7_9BILA
MSANESTILDNAKEADNVEHIGIVHVPLNRLLFLGTFSGCLAIESVSAESRGAIMLSVLPCSKTGKKMVNNVIESTSSLLGAPFGLTIKIYAAFDLPISVEKSYCCFQFFEHSQSKTNWQNGNNPVYACEFYFMFKEVTEKLLDYLQNRSLDVDIYATMKNIESNDQSVQNLIVPQPLTISSASQKLAVLTKLVSEMETAGINEISLALLKSIITDENMDSSITEMKNESPSKSLKVDSQSSSPCKNIVVMTSQQRNSSKKSKYWSQLAKTKHRKKAEDNCRSKLADLTV